MDNLKSKIESILFVYADPMTTKKLSKILEVKEKEVKECIAELIDDYKDKGVNVLEKDGKVQMVSSEKNSEIIEKLVQSSLSEELTPAALETLAVVSYKEPISRSDIDEIRGVNSIFSLRTLLMRGLIEKNQSGTGDKREVFYKTTLDFLKKLGINSVEQLPQYDELSGVSEKNS